MTTALKDYQQKPSFHAPLFEYLKGLKKAKKCVVKYIDEFEELGEGARGETYTCYLKDERFANHPIVLKTRSFDTHYGEYSEPEFFNNEVEALTYLQDAMLRGVIPPYFIFMYLTFTYKKEKTILLEKAEMTLDDYLLDHPLDTAQYFHLFWHIANAIDYLEQVSFNHGDLWSENVLITTNPLSPFGADVKIIDFDAAFQKGNRLISHPANGGTDFFRKSFVLGYDLNRFFDNYLHVHRDYKVRKEVNQKEKFARMRYKAKRRAKQNPNVRVPSTFEEDYISDDSDREFDEQNIQFPEPVLEFLYSLNIQSIDSFKDNPKMSGATIKRKIERFYATFTAPTKNAREPSITETEPELEDVDFESEDSE